VLSNIILAHVVCKKYDFMGKVIYLSIMIRGVLQAQNNVKKLDDKDYYGNKRLECAGYLLGLLFEDKLKVFNSELKK
jgi:DNA-directed RNA polymerase III subunit RPC2